MKCRMRSREGSLALAGIILVCNALAPVLGQQCNEKWQDDMDYCVNPWTSCAGYTVNACPPTAPQQPCQGVTGETPNYVVPGCVDATGCPSCHCIVDPVTNFTWCKQVHSCIWDPSGPYCKTDLLCSTSSFSNYVMWDECTQSGGS